MPLSLQVVYLNISLVNNKLLRVNVLKQFLFFRLIKFNEEIIRSAAALPCGRHDNYSRIYLW